MLKGRGLKKFLSVIIVLLLTGVGNAQDPGIPDTLRFGDWGVYLPCPPCSGIATAPIFIFCDENLHTIKFHLEAQGPLSFSGVEWTSEIDTVFPDKQITLASNRISVFLNNPNLIYPPPLGPGSRYIGYLVLLVEDTGAAVIDTFRPAAPPDSPLIFIATGSQVITPSFFPSPFDLVPQNIKPGDANGDNKTLLADVIY